MRSSIANPDHLALAAPDQTIIHGCNQDWYKTSWQRRAGCGPTTATNLLIYQQRAGRLVLPDPMTTTADGLTLMERVWHHMTPSAMGVHTPGIFHDGLVQFFKANGIVLEPKSLMIPRRRQIRPSISEVVAFIRSGLEQDSPVAFLNLSNGSVKSLDQWHWVTITAIDDSRLPRVELEICDNLNRFSIDLREWYESTSLGGGFVYLVNPATPH